MNKLTASDLEFAQVFTGEPDEIVTDEAYGTHLPPMSLPLETEPMHFGRSFKQAAPIRSVEQEHPWLWLGLRRRDRLCGSGLGSAADMGGGAANTLPEHRQIRMGRTHSAPWDAIDYANPFKGYRPAPNFTKACRAVFAFVVLLICAPIVVHVLFKVFA